MTNITRRGRTVAARHRRWLMALRPGEDGRGGQGRRRAEWLGEGREDFLKHIVPFLFCMAAPRQDHDRNRIARQMSNFCSKTTTLSNLAIVLDACILDFIGQNVAILVSVKYFHIKPLRSFYRRLAIRFSSFFFCERRTSGNLVVIT